ncbi:MAG: hypothetical protein GY855_03945 [candidate division Zixibacteria bacterium]|nr:hypothetical protein [candidate division Zixibacteria bacterium]
MKKTSYVIIVLIPLLALFFWWTIWRAETVSKYELKVLLVSNPLLEDEYNHIIEAYKSVFEEEGIPFEFVKPSWLISQDADDVIKSCPAIIFPDGVCQTLPEDIENWVDSYLEANGNVAIIFDAGTKHIDGLYNKDIPFHRAIGINYNLYDSLQIKSHVNAYIRFKDINSAEYFQIPYGKVSDSLILSGYKYGRLLYPIARVECDNSFDTNSIYAYAIKGNEEYPVISLNKRFNGNVLYINLPLGYLKSHSDDLPLRSIMRTFLFKITHLPHLINTPDGKGGLVINWHIDWNEDRIDGIPFMLKNGYFRKNLEYSIHITAGDFTNYPGDKLGFDACGIGKNTVKAILRYGKIGSHGGWGHNWFSGNIMNQAFGEVEIEKYIKENKECLESIGGYPLLEYSAPNGVYPQPLNTRILEKLGFTCYYSTGDTGSMPNRTFIDKKMVSNYITAFPVLPLGESATLYEMNANNVHYSDVYAWLMNTVSYVRDNRTIRLIYSHSYDVPSNYPQTFKKFIDVVDKESTDGSLNIKSMSYFAEFLQRFLKTDYRFVSTETGMEINVRNPEGLSGIAIAIPKLNFIKPVVTGVDIEEDNDYYYLILKEMLYEKNMDIDNS